jgi:hypothetical protein
MTFDDLRAAHPDLGFALYAYSAGEPVTLEVIDADKSYTFTGWSASAAIAAAFPEPEPAVQEEEDIFS